MLRRAVFHCLARSHIRLLKKRNAENPPSLEVLGVEKSDESDTSGYFLSLI
jgi:hypothetical protein